MVTTRSRSHCMGPTTVETMTATTTLSDPEFPTELVGKKILLASESLGPINGVSRTTQSLIDYLRANGVHVATCAPKYKGAHINAAASTNETKAERKPIVNAEWKQAFGEKSAALGKRALGGAWVYHHEREVVGEQQQSHANRRTKRPLMFARNSEPPAYAQLPTHRRTTNPEFRLQGIPLPYNPDLTVAYPFRLGVVYDHTFTPDLIYLASPASVGFQFLVQLAQLPNSTCPPVLLNFQTDLASYATILFRPPLDRYATWLLQIVQGYLFRVPAVKTIFYPSAYVRQYMEAAGAPGEKMHQLGRGVDTNLFHPSRRDADYRKQIAPNGEIIFTCICRLAPEKGFDFLARVAERLHLSGLKFKLLIVGGNKNPAVESEVRSYFSSLPSGIVIFTGMLRGHALSRAYATADVFLHCSVTETFGLVVLESMASGVPVIARDEGGPSETVKQGRSGFLVPPGDVETFAAMAQQLATDEGMRGRMAGAAREQAVETTWERINCAVAQRIAAAIRGKELERAAEAETADERTELVRKEREKGRVERYYGSLVGMLRVYFAVGVVWVFWLIAVVPLLLCGYVHGLFK